MFERNITSHEIRDVLLNGHVLKEYKDDTPYPSYLILGGQDDRPIHVVAAINDEAKETVIITAYEPTLEEWNKEFNTKRKS